MVPTQADFTSWAQIILHASLHFLVPILFILLCPGISWAGSPVYGAKSAAMGTAFGAIADDPSTMSSNVAGLAGQRETNIYFGGTAVNLSTKFQSPSGQTEETATQFFFPPHLYISSNFGLEKMTFGLGFFSPFGIGGRKWNEQGLTRYVATENTVSTLALNPSFAWKILPSLSFGFGVSCVQSVSEAEKMLNQSIMGAGDAKLSLDADGIGWGYNLGLLLFPQQDFRIGIAYRSRVRVKQEGSVSILGIAPPLQPLFGGTTYKTDIETTLHFPDMASLSVSYRFSKGLTVVVEAERVGWSSFERSDLDIKDEVPLAGFTDSSMELNWKNTWILKGGVEYGVTDNLRLRGGYAYYQSPIPEHTFSPSSPDSHQHDFSVGLGWDRGRWTIDGFYVVALHENKSVRNDILSGTYENLTHALGLSVGYSF